MDAPVRTLFGIPVIAATRLQARQLCRDVVAADGYLDIAVVNAAKIVAMRRDPELDAAVRACPVILADGQSVVMASTLLRRPLPERVAGIDLFDDLLADAAQDGTGVFLLGATEEVVELAVAEAVRRHPGLRVVGYRNGYFTDAEAPAVAEQIRRSGAQLLFLGMSSPKKERFAADYGQATGVNMVHGIGGSLDILAGKVRRAPLLWQRWGLEWLYRMLQEPLRLTMRYLVTNTVFVLLLLRDLLLQRNVAEEGRVLVLPEVTVHAPAVVGSEVSGPGAGRPVVPAPSPGGLAADALQEPIEDELEDALVGRAPGAVA
jgi:N-acetylglucosaminyldiphosphoundecaprenol N-acetyl-beta-D-mannosaminyltransferase